MGEAIGYRETAMRDAHGTPSAHAWLRSGTLYVTGGPGRVRLSQTPGDLSGAEAAFRQALDRLDVAFSAGATRSTAGRRRSAARSISGL